LKLTHFCLYLIFAGFESTGFGITKSQVVHDTFGANGDLLAFKNIALDTEGGDGNATADVLKELGEIRVEILDLTSEQKWGPEYNPPAADFVGSSVTVREGKKAKEFSTVSVSGGKKAGFQRKHLAAGYGSFLSQRGPPVSTLRLKYSRRFTLVVRKIIQANDKGEGALDSDEELEAAIQRRRQKKRQREAEAAALAKAEAEAKAAAEAAKAAAEAAKAARVAVKKEKATPTTQLTGTVDLTLSDDDDDAPPPKIVKQENTAAELID